MAAILYPEHAMSNKFVFPPGVHALPIIGSSDLFPVRRIYCVGRNYRDHVREMREADERDPPFFFSEAF